MLYEIHKKCKDYGKFCYIVKDLGDGRVRVTTLDGFRNVFTMSELVEVY